MPKRAGCAGTPLKRSADDLPSLSGFLPVSARCCLLIPTIGAKRAGRSGNARSGFLVENSVDISLQVLDSASSFEVASQSGQDLRQRLVSDPPLKPSVTRLIRRISAWQVIMLRRIARRARFRVTSGYSACACGNCWGAAVPTVWMSSLLRSLVATRLVPSAETAPEAGDHVRADGARGNRREPRGRLDRPALTNWSTIGLLGRAALTLEEPPRE
jgi:hypothetical protein